MSTAQGIGVFATRIGPCGMAWGAGGLLGLLLPEDSEAATRERLAQRFPSAQWAAASPEAADAQQRIQVLMRGEPADLSPIVLDMDGVAAFPRRVYAVARTIPAGQTITYGELAARLGDPGAARAVGHALGRNPFVIVVPCHRVLAAQGRTGGFSAPGGVTTKLRLLAIEGALEPTLFD